MCFTAVALSVVPMGYDVEMVLRSYIYIPRTGHPMNNYLLYLPGIFGTSGIFGTGGRVRFLEFSGVVRGKHFPQSRHIDKNLLSAVVHECLRETPDDTAMAITKKTFIDPPPVNENLAVFLFVVNIFAPGEWAWTYYSCLYSSSTMNCLHTVSRCHNLCWTKRAK